MSIAAYWLSNYIVDSIKMEISSALVIALMHIFGINIPYSWLVLVLLPFLLMPYAYLF